jgi:hypothetical protein
MLRRSIDARLTLTQNSAHQCALVWRLRAQGHYGVEPITADKRSCQHKVSTKYNIEQQRYELSVTMKKESRLRDSLQSAPEGQER